MLSSGGKKEIGYDPQKFSEDKKYNTQIWIEENESKQSDKKFLNIEQFRKKWYSQIEYEDDADRFFFGTDAHF